MFRDPVEYIMIMWLLIDSTKYALFLNKVVNVEFTISKDFQLFFFLFMSNLSIKEISEIAWFLLRLIWSGP